MLVTPGRPPRTRARRDPAPSLSMEASCSVAVVGAPGSGKTTLVAAMARLAGEPVVDEGPTTGIRISSLTWMGVRLHVVDTPGEPELVGGVRAGLRTADGVVFVVSAVDGLDGQTAMLWQECAANQRVRVLAITDLDDERADFDETLAVCQRVLGDVQPGTGTAPPILAALVPLGDDEGVVAGLLDLIALRVLDHSGDEGHERAADPEHVAAVAGVRDDLIHAAVAGTDDEVLLDQVLSGSTPDPHRLALAALDAVAMDALNLAYPLAAPAGIGVRQLLDALVTALPRAAPREAPAAQSLDGEPRDLAAGWHGSPDGPLVAEVVSSRVVRADDGSHVLRVWAGVTRGGEQVWVTPLHGDPFAATLTTEDDTGSDSAVSHLAAVRLSPAAGTGAVLSSTGEPLRIASWGLPEAALEVSVLSDSPDLAAQLRAVLADDPVAWLRSDEREVVLRCAGPVHAAAVIAALAGRGVQATWQASRTALRSTVKRAVNVAEASGTRLTVTPLPRGSGIETEHQAFSDAAGAAPFPLVDVSLELDGPAPAPDAAQRLIAAAVAEAGVVLEPVDQVVVVVSDEYAAAVHEDVRRRRGRVVETVAAGGGRTRLTAVLPHESLARYGLELRAVTHGTATWVREPHGVEPMPSYLAARLLSAAVGFTRTDLPLA